ncbi:MAG TPA: ABC transporter permease, partial [Ilumatobacter sp.]
MTDVLAAEILKLRTTRTVWALLAATLAVTGLAVTGAVYAGAGSDNLDLESAEGVRTVLHVSASGAIFVLILGIIISAGEYRQRTATDTFLTTPDRRRVVGAKLIVGAATGVVFGALSAGVAMFVADHVYDIKGLSFPLGSGDTWSILGGAVAYAALFGALGAATGSLVREQVTAIVGWLAWLFVAENIIVLLGTDVGRWLPGAAGRALVREPSDGLLSQPAGGVVLAVWAG